jgi:phenylacetate-CoA ligase
MGDRTLALYHRLPASARSCVASARGYYLRSWRYGAETERLVEEALCREQWSTNRWTQWQNEQLAVVLHRAATRVPYYRDYWSQRRARGDHSSWELLENWPLLEKDEVRKCPEAFVADDCSTSSMYEERTSGTSGKPLKVWWSRLTVRKWFALFEARCRKWYGNSRQDRWAMLGGQLVTPHAQVHPPFWVWNRALNQLYLSSFHLAPHLVSHHLDALERYRIKYLVGYPSSISALAQGALRLKRRYQMSVVVTNAEPVHDWHRRVIEEVFQCPVRETYGMAEIVAGASECKYGRLHQWPEVGLVESLPKEGNGAEFVCTSLLNSDMPLIRYRVGDCGQAPVSIPCECGRTLPVIAGLKGRSNDMLLTQDGRKVFWINPIFYGMPVHAAQVIQETREFIRILYVQAPGYNSSVQQVIANRLRQRVGNIQFTFEPVEELPRDPSGKVRAVICRVPAAQQEIAVYAN